jgi:hypothetical protein
MKKIVEDEDDYYDREQNYGGYGERPETLGGHSDNYEEDNSFGTSYGSRQRNQNFERVSFNSPPKSASRNRRSIGEDIHFEPSQVSSRSRRSMGEDIHFEPPQPSSRSRRSMGSYDFHSNMSLELLLIKIYIIISQFKKSKMQEIK